MTGRSRVAGVRRLTSRTSTTRKPSTTVLSFTATLFHVLAVLFSANFPPAASALRTIQDEPFATAAAARLQAFNVAQSAPPSPEPRPVKCIYFETAPLRTYCYVLGLERPLTASEAKLECQALSMNLVNSQTTTVDRLCEAVRRLGLVNQGMWIDFASGEAKIVSWDTRDPQDLRAKIAEVPASCAYCNVAAVCDVDFYHSNGPRCIATEEGSKRVEYCYSEQTVEAVQATNGCRAQSAEPVNVLAMRDTLVDYIKGIIRTDLEFWFDFQDKDVSALNGVVAFDAQGIDLNVSCVTVWFGRPVPWFFKQDCSKTYSVICEGSKRQNRPLDPSFRRCADQPRNSGTLQYCMSKSNAFSTTSGAQFCQGHAMSLLRPSTLHEALYAFSLLERQWEEQHFEQFLIWDADYAPNGPVTSQTCVAKSLIHIPPKMYQRDCSEAHGYICKYDRKATLETAVRSRNYYALDQSSLSAKARAAAQASCSCKSPGATLGTCERSSIQPNWVNDSLCISEKLRQKLEVLNTMANIYDVPNELKFLDRVVTTLPDIITMPYHLSRIYDKVAVVIQTESEADRIRYTKEFTDVVIDIVHRVTLKTKIWACLAEDERLQEASNLVMAIEDLVSRAVKEWQAPFARQRNPKYC